MKKDATEKKEEIDVPPELKKTTLVAFEDLEFWIKAGSIQPSVETLREVVKQVKKWKPVWGDVFVHWLSNGKFAISNSKTFSERCVVNS